MTVSSRCEHESSMCQRKETYYEIGGHSHTFLHTNTYSDNISQELYLFYDVAKYEMLKVMQSWCKEKSCRKRAFSDIDMDSTIGSACTNQLALTDPLKKSAAATSAVHHFLINY